MRRRRVLVLNLGWEQLPLVEQLARPERGLDLYAVHNDSTRIPHFEFREILIADMRDLVRILEFADRIQPDAVISDECDYALFAQALLTDRFGIPGPGIPAACQSTNKLFQRELSVSGGIAVPEFSVVLGALDATKFGDRIGWPIILKPCDNRGSLGVSVVNEPDEVEEAFTKAVVNSHSRVVLAERYIFGQHLTIDGYSAPGGAPVVLALGENLKFGGESGTVNEAIVYCHTLDVPAYREAWELAQQTAVALGFRFGPFHGEYIVERDTGKVFLTEMSNRGGGVHISNIAVPVIAGIDVVNQHIDDALGIGAGMPLRQTTPPRSVMLRFFADNSFAGRRLGVAPNFKPILENPDVLCCRSFVAPGETFGTLDNGGAGRHGMVIVAAADCADLEKVASAAIRRFAIELSSSLA